MKRKAQARWTGDLRSGEGHIKLGSGAFEGQYNFSGRFENGKGTNPEELIAAALAGCYTMALNNSLSMAGHNVKGVESTAFVHLEKGETGGSSITRIEITTRGDVEGISEAEFMKFAEETKSGCIVSRALAAVPISLDVEFAGA